MSQVSLLSVDVAQAPDLKGVKGDVSISSQAKSNAFSDAMEQYYPNKAPLKQQEKSKEDGNSASKAANTQPPVDESTNTSKQTKLSEAKNDTPASKPEAERVNTDKVQVGKPLTTGILDSRNAHILPVPLPIDNLALLEQLKKSHDGQILPVPLPIDDKSLTTDLTAKLKLVDAEEILPVAPIVNAEQLNTVISDAEDTSNLPVKKSIDVEHLLARVSAKNDAEILPVPISPLNTEIDNSEFGDKTLKADANVPTIDKKPTVDLSFHAQIKLQEGQPSNVLVNKTDTDDAVDLLKMLNGAQNFITKKGAEVSHNELSSQSAVSKVEQAPEANKQTPETNKQTPEANKQTVEQNILSKILKSDVIKAPLKNDDAQQVKLVVGVDSTDKQLKSENKENKAKQAEQPVVKVGATAGIVPESAIEDDAKAVLIEDVIDVDLLAKQAKLDVAKQEVNTNVNQEIVKPVAVISEKNTIAIEQIVKVDLQKAEKIAPTENKVAVTEFKDSNVQNVKLNHDVDSKRIADNEILQPRTINQSTAAVVGTATVQAKVDGEQKLSNKVSSEKSVVEDVEKLPKTDHDKLMPQAEKIASVFNQSLDAQAAKSIISPSELAMQQEQSYESITNKLTTNTVQTQKSITALNAETIAIYRKDFTDAVKDKVMVMINQKIQQVEIQLDPPEMGNIHIRVNLQNEQAAVQFVVQNQQAKEALEQNMGKLRDMLAESGVDVGDANIEQRQAKEQSGDGTESDNSHGKNGELADSNVSENDNSVMNVVKASSTGVDYYA